MPDSNEKPAYLEHRKRLWKRVERSEFTGFQDHEILELLLTYAIPRKDTKKMAWPMLKRFNKSFSKAIDARSEEIEDIKGLGPRTADFFLLIKETMRRYYLDKMKFEEAVSSIKSPKDVLIRYCRASLEKKSDEVFEVLYLNTRNKVIATEKLFTGTIDRTAVYPRKVIEGALKNKATGLIFVHNHPSGDPSPSREDERLTRELAEAAKAVGITVHDHIIIGRGTHFSFRERGILK